MLSGSHCKTYVVQYSKVQCSTCAVQAFSQRKRVRGLIEPPTYVNLLLLIQCIAIELGFQTRLAVQIKHDSLNNF